MSAPGGVPGHIDVFEQDIGLTFITGWLRAEPETLNATGALLRLAPAGGEPSDWPLRRLYPRADLPPAAGLPQGLGFQVLIPGAPAWRAVTATLVVGETAVPLTPEPLEPAPFVPRGHLAPVSRQGLAGWVLDRPGRVPRLLVDGCHAVPLRLALPRRDLLFDDGTDGWRFGFRLSLRELAEALLAADPPVTLRDGERHAVTLVAGGVELGHEILRLRRSRDGVLDQLWTSPVEGREAEAGPAGPPDPGRVLPAARPATPPPRDLLALPAGAHPPGDTSSRPVGDTPSRPLVDLPPRAAGDVSPRPSGDTPPRPSGDAPPVAPWEGGLAEAPPPWRPDRGVLLDTLPQEGLPRVSVVVPIHNAAAELAPCIASVLRHSTGQARLILIDDASTDPAVGALLAAYDGQPGIEVHRSKQNLGFTRTANIGFGLAGRDDVVLLNSDTEVGPGWLDGLRLAAHSGPRIGTVTAISNNAGAFSVPEFDTDNPLPPWLAPADMARLARQAALSLWPAAPTGSGFCLYIRRACLDAVGRFDEVAFPRGYGEENDFCMRAAQAGFRHLVDDRSYVWHRRTASFGAARQQHVEAARQVLAARYPEYGMLARQFREDDAFRTLRRQVRQALAVRQEARERPRPRVLFVIAGETGGTPQTNRDLMAALSDRYEPWVLASNGQEVTLARPGTRAPLERHRLGRPVEPASHRSADYDRVVADLLLRHGFELVHIRHLAWHGLGLGAACEALGIPVVFSFHDFYTVCPTVKLLDGDLHFCGGRCTPGEKDCTAELWPAVAMPPLRGRFAPRWRAMMGRAIAGSDAFVTTSPATRQVLLEAFPDLPPAALRLIPHGRSFARMASLAAEPTMDEPLRVLVPGNISVAKGAALIAAIAALDSEREVEFHLLGAVDASLETPRPGIVRHGRYERDGFAARVREIEPHLGAILSIWPETYCHTLTECWAVGLPVLGLATGAVGERIGAEGGGWLLDPDASPAAILHHLRWLKQDIRDLRRRRDEVLDWQRRLGRHYDAAGMATAYDRLYREVLQRRRSFAGWSAPESVPVVLCVGRRPAPGALRLPLPLRNGIDRPVIYREVLPSYPFGDAAAGPADLVLLRAGALSPSLVAEVIPRCVAAGLKLLVEMDEPMAVAASLGIGEAAASRLLGTDLSAAAGTAPLAAATATLAATAALLAAATALLAATPRAAALLAEAGHAALPVPQVIDAAAWQPVDPAWRQASPGCRLLGFADDAALRPLVAALPASEAAALVTVQDTAEEGLLPALRAAAGKGCHLALLPTPLAVPGEPEERHLLCAMLGLVVLRPAAPGEAEGDTAQGHVALPADLAAWPAAIAALAADTARRAALAQRAQAAAATRCRYGGWEAELDALVLRLMAAAPEQADRLARRLGGVA